MKDLVIAIKKAMRISHNALDSDIESNIMTAVSDLSRVGIQPYTGVRKKELKSNPLIKKAIELYCKAQANYMGEGTKFEASYEKLRDAMSLCGDYLE